MICGCRYDMKRPPLGHHTEGWFWSKKPVGAGDLETCCSRRPLVRWGLVRWGPQQRTELDLPDPQSNAAVLFGWDEGAQHALGLLTSVFF